MPSSTGRIYGSNPVPVTNTQSRCKTGGDHIWRLWEEIVCPLCRYEVDPDPPAGEIYLVVLPEFSQMEVNVLMYTLLKPILAAQLVSQSHTVAPALHRTQSLLDALGQRQRDSLDHLPVLASLQTLRQSLQALPAAQRDAALENLSGLRYLPNFNSKVILRKLSLII